VFIKVVGTSFTEIFAANECKPFQSCLFTIVFYSFPSLESVCKGTMRKRKHDPGLSIFCIFSDAYPYGVERAYDEYGSSSYSGWLSNSRSVSSTLEVNQRSLAKQLHLLLQISTMNTDTTCYCKSGGTVSRRVNYWNWFWTGWEALLFKTCFPRKNAYYIKSTLTTYIYDIYREDRKVVPLGAKKKNCDRTITQIVILN
jgi:hypothetical protein